jgi:pimeloyl-ACP methyl ester carboxylesterase
MASLHSIRARLLASAAAFWIAGGAEGVAQTQTSGPAASTFTIFIRSARIGTEQIAVERTVDGWTITSNGRIGAPVDIVTRRLQLRYDAEWKPLGLTLDAVIRGQPTTLQTTIAGTTATSEMVSGGTPSQKTDTIEPDSILLPNPAFGSYEALAARLSGAKPGSTIPIYIAPQGTMTATVGESVGEQIQTPARLVKANRTLVTIARPGVPPLDVEVWIDAETNRLLRLSVPAQSLDVVREDIGSVAARRVTVTRAGDEQVRIPAAGFSLAGTVSKPANATAARLPAVVLVGGSGPTDRDELVAGIPMFGQLAGALADAGFLVLRYDKRGVGQSGGRPEAATIADYAEDLRAVVRFVADRRDVDRARLAVAGHADGGSVGMLAAAREDRIRALVLIATVGVTGADLNMAQVTHALARSGRPEAERQKTLELQKQIQQAVLTGKGWDAVPPALRQQADTPWFQSFLAFDPAKVMRDVDQPILIVQGSLDKQVDPANAEKLAAIAKARRRQAASDLVIVPGVNHLLVPAATGEVDEYGSLNGQDVSPEVPKAIADWLTRVFARP